jgi:hypothetical protein
MSVSHAEDTPAVRWTPDAEARLERAPAFLRPVVRKITEKRAREAGVAEITEEFLSRIKNETMQGREPVAEPGPFGAGREIHPSSHSPIHRFTDRPLVTWTQEARSRLEEIPPAMREIVTKIVEEAAGEAGEPIVTADLFDRIEEGGEAAVSERAALPWTEGAKELLELRLVRTPEPALPFARGALMGDVELEAARLGIAEITEESLKRIWSEINAQGRERSVEWSEEAWARLQNAPEFVRAGIRKAAEKRARGMGARAITGPLLTKFRNEAMMKAVRRIRKLGFKELTFDAFDKAMETIPKLKDPGARKRLADIRAYMAERGDRHLLDADLMERFRKYLREGGNL